MSEMDDAIAKMLGPELAKTFEREQAKANAVTLEVMADIFHRMPWGVKITVGDGRVGALKKFGEPHLSSEGPAFGFDFVFEGGGHIEFHAYNTGWGGPVGSPMADPANP